MKILAFTILMPAHVYPFIPILRALAERGHEVRLAACTSRKGQDLPDIGEIPARVLLVPSAALPGQQSTRDRFQQMFASHGEPLAFALEEQIRAEAPDLLIVDPMAWGAMVAAEASGLPWVSLSHNPVTIRGTGEDLRGPGIHPRALKGVRGLFFRPLLRRRIQQADHILLPELNRVRSLRGLSPFRTQADLFRAPFPDARNHGRAVRIPETGLARIASVRRPVTLGAWDDLGYGARSRRFEAGRPAYGLLSPRRAFPQSLVG